MMAALQAFDGNLLSHEVNTSDGSFFRPSKRQRRVSPDNSQVNDSCDDSDSNSKLELNGVDNKVYPMHFVEDAESILQNEDPLVEKVLELFEKVKAKKESTMQQRKVKSNGSESEDDELLRYSIYDALSLLVRSESQLRGETKLERIDLFLTIKSILQDEMSFDIPSDYLLQRFLDILQSRRDLFPPQFIFIAPKSKTNLQNGGSTITSLNNDNKISALFGEVIQSHSNLSSEMHNIFSVWLAISSVMPRLSLAQTEIVQDTVNRVLDKNCDTDCLLWNLAYFVARTPSP